MEPRDVLASMNSVPLVVEPDGTPPPAPRPAPEGLDPALHALHRHVLLRESPEVVAALVAAMEPVTLEPGQVLFAPGTPPDAVYLLLSGEVKLVGRRDLMLRPELHSDEIAGREVDLLLAQAGPGAWAGLPLLAWAAARARVSGTPREVQARIQRLEVEHDRLGRRRAKLDAPPDERESLEDRIDVVTRELAEARRDHAVQSPPRSDLRAVVLPQRPGVDGPPRALRLPLDAGVAIAEEFPAFRSLVEHAAVLQARKDVHARIAANPILGGLGDVQVTTLLQLGALVRIDHQANESARAWLPAGVPAGCVGLLIEGAGQVYAANDDNHLVSDVGVGELVGHETLLHPDERTADDFRAAITAGGAMPEVVVLDEPEPARPTAAYLNDGSLVMVVDWQSLRELLAARRPSWFRAVAWYSPGTAAEQHDPAEVIAVVGERRGLGATTLAYGTAAAVVRAMAERSDLPQRPSLPEIPVFVADFRGEETWAPWLRSPSYMRLRLPYPGSDGTTRTASFVQHVPGTPDPLGIARIGVTWGDDPVGMADGIAQLQLLPGARFVFVTGISGDHPAFPLAATEMARSRATVLWVTEDPGGEYGLTPELPERLIRVDRLTPDHHRRAMAQAEAAADAWAAPADAPPEAPPPIQHGTARVPDDPAGAKAFRELRLHELWDRRDAPLARAFERLARIVRRRTVGLALGGGGVWGAAHIALIRELEAVGVPVDYVAGTSFGAVVAGVYAAGGVPALERFLREACPNRFQNSAALSVPYLLARSELFRAMTVKALTSTEAVQEAIDGTLHRETGQPVIPLASTPIPFLPVSTNLDSTAPFTTFHGSVGFGVRASSGLPPALVGMWHRGERILDGALVANVPAEIVRLAGADYVVSANVVGPRTADVTNNGKRQQAWDATAGRVLDALRGLFLLGWKAGDDQGRLRADYRVDAWTTGAEFTDFWKGQAIVEAFQRGLFGQQVAWDIRRRWHRLPKRGDCPLARVKADVERVLAE